MDHICWIDDTVCEECAVEYVPLDEVDIDVIDIGNNETLVIRASKDEESCQHGMAMWLCASPGGSKESPHYPTHM